jgi:hypothetical protein
MNTEITPEQELQALANIGRVVADEPYTFTVSVKWQPEPQAIKILKRTFFDKLLNKTPPAEHRINEPEQERTFKVYPCVVGNMYRIASRAATLPGEILNGEAATILLPLIPEHLPTMIYIIAAAIQNNHFEPDAALIQFIERNFTQDDVFEALYASLEGMGLNVFYNSIALVKGTVKIIQPEASPVVGGE